MTPLILAAKKKKEQLFNVLIHAGADMDAQDVQSTNFNYIIVLSFMQKKLC
jgi:hypothetical protein